MRVSIAVGALTFYPIETTLAYAGASSADGVEVLVDRTVLTLGPEQVDRLALARGAPILTVHSQLHFREKSLATKITDDVASINFAAALPTCEAIVLHPPLTGQRPSADLNHWLEAISAARARGPKPDLCLGIENRGENHDGTEQQYLDDPSRLRRVVEEWDMSITLDIAHAASHGQDIVEAISICIPRLANVHLSDVHKRKMRGGIRNGLLRDHQMPGEGVLPLDRVVTALHAGRYQGALTVELSPYSLHAWWPASARRRVQLAAERTHALVTRARTSIDWSRTLPRSTVQRREETRPDA